jgi:hypothetical protein
LEHFFLPHAREVIQNIKIYGSAHEDLLAWHYEKSGVFTVKSPYRLSVQIREQERVVCNTSINNMGERSIWTLIWRQNSSEDQNFLMVSCE